MPMTTEQATVGGRETFGEPKKIGQVTIDVDGDRVHARFDRMGFPLADVRRARSARAIDIPRQGQGRLLLQVQPVARRQGLRHRARARARAPPRRGARRPRDRRHADAARLAARPDRRHPGRPDRLDAVRAGRDDASTARSSSAFPPTGCCRTCTSVTTTCPCSGKRRTEHDSERAATRSSRPTRTPGCPCEEYRPYLDPRLPRGVRRVPRRAPGEPRPADGVELRLHHQLGDRRTKRACAARTTPQQRDKEMDADGVAAEVIFPDADAITGMESPPFGAGLSAGHDRGSRARVRGRARAQPLPRRAVRRRAPSAAAGIGLVPICHDIDARGRGDRVARRQARHPRDHGPDDVARPPAVQPSRRTTRCGPRARPRSFPVHTHSGEAPREEMNEFIGIYLAEVVFWTHRPISHLLFSGAFERFPGLKFVVTEGASLLGRRHEVEVGPVLRRRSHHEEDGRADEGHPLEAAVGVLRHEHLRRARRRCRRRRSAAATRSAATSRCGAPTTRIPKARGRTRSSGCAATSATCPSATPASCSARPRRVATASTSTALRPIAERDRPDARRPRPGRHARHDPRRDPARASGGRTSTRCSGVADVT